MTNIFAGYTKVTTGYLRKQPNSYYKTMADSIDRRNRQGNIHLDVYVRRQDNGDLSVLTKAA